MTLGLLPGWRKKASSMEIEVVSAMGIGGETKCRKERTCEGREKLGILKI